MYDIAIIGAGPGGYVAAIRAAQLGMKVGLIEKEQVGGVCLNRGCIPTKAMIASAHALHTVFKAKDFGIALDAGTAKIDMAKLQSRKDAVVTNLRNGVLSLLKSNGVDLIKGVASFAGTDKLLVDGGRIESKRYLIATGSSWIKLPNLKVDGKMIVTTDEALSWTDVPARLIIVGGGVIGSEFACMMNEFGSKVTIIEATQSILPPVEKAISRLLARFMKSKGIEIVTGTTAENVEINQNEISVKLSSGGEKVAEKMLVAVGRRALVSELNLDAVGVETDSRGFIKVDDNFKTTSNNIYAVGDAIGNPMLAHAASAAAVACIEGIMGKKVEHGLAFCPSPIFTSPEIGAVGATSEELTQKGVSFKTGRFPYAANGKAMCEGEVDGQALVHTDNDGKILGAHIIGLDAATIIGEAALAIKNGLTAIDVIRTIHSHPTLSEIFAEATEDALGSAIHKARSTVRQA